MRILLFYFLAVFSLFGQNILKTEIYEVSEMTGQQVVYASFLKADALKDANPLEKITDEDRMALSAAMSQEGANIPSLQGPHVVKDVKFSPAKLTIITVKEDNGEIKTLARLEYDKGRDNLEVINHGDMTNCILVEKRMLQTYTIHRNVKLPGGENLITCLTVRNSPIAVSTMTLSGKIKRVN
jgi:hypothetical protein